MSRQSSARSYADRLFGRGLYGRHHQGRFDWLRETLRRVNPGPTTFIELGCYDGRAIEFIPHEIRRYVGFDAGWESGRVDGRPVGIDAAIERYEADPRFEFHRSNSPDDLRDLPGTFDVGISLETIEHIVPGLVPAYVEALAERVHGTLVISVPNEKGLPLLAKMVGSKILRVNRGMHYRPVELVNALLGRMQEVERNDHKGFDWEDVVREVERHFDHVAVEAVGFGIGSPHLSMTVGIVASGSRRARNAR